MSSHGLVEKQGTVIHLKGRNLYQGQCKQQCTTGVCFTSVALSDLYEIISILVQIANQFNLQMIQSGEVANSKEFTK